MLEPEGQMALRVCRQTGAHRQEAKERREASRVPTGAGPHSQGHTLGLLRNQSLNTLTASASVDPVPWASHLPVAPGLSPAITE